MYFSCELSEQIQLHEQGWGLPQAPESVAKDTGESLNVGGSARIELEVVVSHTVGLTSFVITDHTQPLLRVAGREILPLSKGPRYLLFGVNIVQLVEMLTVRKKGVITKIGVGNVFIRIRAAKRRPNPDMIRRLHQLFTLQHSPYSLSLPQIVTVLSFIKNMPPFLTLYSARAG